MHNHNRIPFVFVPLTKGQISIIDAEDASRVLAFTWCYYSGYAGRRARKGEPGFRAHADRDVVYIHQVVQSCESGTVPDHINGNVLDNRRANLRCATPSQNSSNTKRITAANTSGIRGASFVYGKWEARIRHNGKLLYLGRFTSQEEAGLAYDRAAIELHGEFATLNYPEAW